MRYLIIGASHGIGYAIAEQLMSEGHTVIAWSRTTGDLSALPGVEYAHYDVSSTAALPELDGALDGIVYCPGTINLKPFHRLTEQDFMQDFQVNTMGAVKVLQKLMPNIKQGQYPSVVLFSTVAVSTGMTFHASVAMAKGALEGLTRSLAAEWAPLVRVNAIAPSLTDTPLAERLVNSPEKREASANRHPLKAIGNAEDVAAMAVFLLSPKSKWITGQVLAMDGGMSALRV